MAVRASSEPTRSASGTAVGSGSTHGRRGGGWSRQRAATARASSSPAMAACTGCGGSPASDSRARPRADAGIAAAASVPITAELSARLFTRSEMRRSVFASTASRTTPAGRCVQSTRWMPSERPRAARSANRACRSGWSASIAANSSTTITSRGIPGTASMSRALGVGERALAEPQLGAQALERAQRAVLVEVGHDSHGVRQRLERRERRAALEVDEQERDPLGWMPRRHREHPRDEQLALAAARRAAHDGVRAVLDEVDVHRARPAHGERRASPRASAAGGSSSESSGTTDGSTAVVLDETLARGFSGECVRPRRSPPAASPPRRGSCGARRDRDAR